MVAEIRKEEVMAIRNRFPTKVPVSSGHVENVLFE